MNIDNPLTILLMLLQNEYNIKCTCTSFWWMIYSWVGIFSAAANYLLLCMWPTRLMF